MRHLVDNYPLPDIKDPATSETDVRAAIFTIRENRFRLREREEIYLAWLANKHLRRVKKADKKETYRNDGRTGVYKVEDDYYEDKGY